MHPNLLAKAQVHIYHDSVPEAKLSIALTHNFGGAVRTVVVMHLAISEDVFTLRA